MLENRVLEVIIIALVVLVLFGAKRLPDTARSLGKSMRILKAESRASREEATHQPSAHQPSAQPDEPPVLVKSEGSAHDSRTLPTETADRKREMIRD